MKIVVPSETVDSNLHNATTIEDLLNEFLASADLKPISANSYRKKLRVFFRWCSTEKISSPNRQTLLEYKRYLVARGFTAYSISGYLVPVRCLFRWLSTMNPVFQDIGASVKGVRRPKGHCRDAYSTEQVRSILAAIDRTTLVGKRDFALLRLLATTGLRSVEVTRASIENIRRVGNEHVLFVRSKGSDAFDDVVALVDETLQAILEYLTARGPVKATEPLFASLSDGNCGARLSTRTLRRIARDRAKACSIVSPTLSSCHSYRHFFVASAVDAGLDIDSVREAARHRSIVSTQIYIHRSERSKGRVEKTVDQTLRSGHTTDDGRR